MEENKKNTDLCEFEKFSRRLEKEEILNGFNEMSNLIFLLQSNINLFDEFDGEESELALIHISRALADLNIMFADLLQKFTFHEEHFIGEQCNE